MRKLLILLSVFASVQASAQEDYTIRVNGVAYPVALDKPYDLTVGGNKITVQVSANDSMTYRNEMFSFKYPKAYKVSKTQVSDGLEQISILNAEGSGFAIQRYSTIDPSSLNELMLKEVTKESLNYGFKEERSSYTKTLRSGQNIVMTRSVLTYKDDRNVYEVGSLGMKDSGILILIINTGISTKQSDEVVGMMWKTLSLN
jgi:hypothetical protein